jgi:hypothetical protein
MKPVEESKTSREEGRGQRAEGSPNEKISSP